MKRVLAFLMMAIVALGLFTACGSSEKPKEQAAAGNLKGMVATDGSTSMAKVIGALGESFTTKNPQVTFAYNPTGSGSGITAVNEGRCDIGLASRALKEKEKAGGLQETVLAYDGIAIVVNPGNGVQNLTLEQLADIYTGKITDWQELGGKAGEIVLIGRDAGSGTRDGFESITKSKDQCRYRQELTSTGDVIANVAQNQNAIGYASLSAVSDNVKAVQINGVTPSESTIKDGSYAVQRPFMLITKQGVKLNPVAQAFFDYITSSQVADIISQAGVVPAN